MGIRDLFRKKGKKNFQALVHMGGDSVAGSLAGGALQRFIDGGFAQNATLFSCIMLNAKVSAKVKFKIYRENREGDKEEIGPKDKCYKLYKLLSRPNEQYGGTQFLQASYAYQFLAGNTYIKMLSPTADNMPTSSKPPMELEILRPERVEPVKAIDGSVVYYKYQIGNGQFEKIPAEQVIHIQTFNPTSSLGGFSPVGPSAVGIDSDNAAAKWNYSLLKNGAKFTGMLMVNGELSDDQFEALEQTIKGRYSGEDKVGKVLLLESGEGGMDWKETSMTPTDMDWSAGRKLSKIDIYVAQGVPPELVGDKEHATYNNLKEAKKQHMTDTVLPVVENLISELNHKLVPLFDEGCWLEINLNEIEVLQESRDSVWDRALRAFDSGAITRNQFLEIVGLESEPNGDVYKVRFSETFLPSGVNASETVEPEDQDEDIKKKAFQLNNDDAKAQYWKFFDSMRWGWLNRIKSNAHKRLSSVLTTTLDSMKSAPTATFAIQEASRTIEEFEPEWQKFFVETYTGVGQDFFVRTHNQFKGHKSFETKQTDQQLIDAWASLVDEYMYTHAGSKIAMISETTKRWIINEVEKGVSAGKGIEQIVRDLEANVKGITTVRAERIARTEIVGASNFASQEAAKATGLPLMKRWLSTKDTRTRDTHTSVDGQTKAMNEPYNLPGGDLMYPGDSSLGAVAGEVINCRCTEVYEVEGSEVDG